MSYVLPQVQVFQEFREVPTTTVQNLNTLIMGQQYALFRYDEVDERELISLGAYDPTVDTDYDYPNRPSGATVDLDYLALYGELIWLRYFGSSVHLHVPANDELNKVYSPSTYIFKTANGFTRNGGLLKDVEAGDKIKYTVTPAATGVEVVGYSTITALEPDYSTADLEDPAAVDAANQATVAASRCCERRCRIHCFHLWHRGGRWCQRHLLPRPGQWRARRHLYGPGHEDRRPVRRGWHPGRGYRLQRHRHLLPHASSGRGCRGRHWLDLRRGQPGDLAHHFDG